MRGLNPRIHIFVFREEDVDGPIKSGHDGWREWLIYLYTGYLCRRDSGLALSLLRRMGLNHRRFCGD
jgi:hypothetical protein